MPIAAIKIGMMGNAATVADCLDGMQDIPVVLDPLFRASSDRRLIDKEGQCAMLKRLFPLATLLTPNLLEAAALCGLPVADDEDAMLDQAIRLLRLGSNALLLKGGHGAGDYVVDLLVEEGKNPHRFAAPRLSTTMRGTGCTLSTAIAAQLAIGKSLAESCQIAKAYVLEKMKISMSIAN